MSNEVQNGRLINYRRELVWRAWEEPEYLTKWFGPNGFTSTFHEFNFCAGGDWKFVFRGPDGKNYDNHNRFIEIKKPERIVFDHLSKPHIFRLEVTFTELNNKTKVNFHMTHEMPIEPLFRDFLAEANEQNFDRLEAELKRMSEKQK